MYIKTEQKGIFEMGLIDDIKNDVKKAGANKGKIMYFREGQKVRIRFLEDMDDGRKFTFHDSFSEGINVPCQQDMGRDCKYCEMENLRTRDQYCWCVYDYESNEVKLLLAPVNNCSPIPAIMSMYEAYGTLLDRDYVLTVTGKQQNKTFSVVPMDKNKFRNTKAKPFSESKIVSIIDKAYPAEDDDDEDSDDYEDRKRKKPAKESKKSKKRRDDYEEDEDGVDEDSDDDDGDGEDYEDMTPQELYKLCKKRDIECAPKKSAKYYINLLNEADKAEDDWGDDEEDEEDDWDD